ncbi:MAG TPA: hypothetical protein VLG37_00510 [Candidatus Saccharimonadales bacterium]|nr:hypothetical protein [Candidatus Saccharimonadales bacterium]
MRRIWYLLAIVSLLVGGYSAWALRRPLPLLQPASVLATLPKPTINPLAWPAYGQAAIGGLGYGVLASNGGEQPKPTASVAKVMAALAVLRKKPLKLGEQGSSLTLSSQDIAFYHGYVAKEGSVVAVNYGEQISEYQALQATLIASANNMAASLVTWAFGSEQAYLDYANSLAAELGLKNTHIADPSGFEPSTVSTATDLVKLGQAALQNPVLAQIVSQVQAEIPVAGTIHSTNLMLGNSGISGIKTGNTDEAGGVYLAAGTYSLAGQHPVTVITAIMGAPSLGKAMNDSLPLLASAQANFTERSLVKAGQIVGYYNTPWGTSAHIIADDKLTDFGWKGTLPRLKLSLQPQRAPARSGQIVGSISLETAEKDNPQKISVSLEQPLTPPDWQWRLLHP